MESIIQTEKKCYITGATQNLDLHHLLHGTANRKNADKYGLTIWLEHSLHMRVHDEGLYDEELKRLGQRKFEQVHGTREDFIRIFGRSYL